VFIAAFVALQFLVPLTYLLRDDATDERFTWRSLAGSDAPECVAEATIQRTNGALVSIKLEDELHEDWLDYVRVGRRAVVDAFLERQCAEKDAASVELVTRCATGDERVFDRDCRRTAAHPRTAAR
jgi:hypothetical protein